jgi:tetratricopeptide (TPR) repeat protein
MKYFTKKIYLILYLISTITLGTEANSLNNKNLYSKTSISNYFSGIVSKNDADNKLALKYLNESQHLKKNHDNFNTQFIRTLVILEKFDKAFSFSKDIWVEDYNLFEPNLLLGIQSFIKKDFKNAEKYFQRMNNTSYHFSFERILGNIMMSWTMAANNNEIDSFKILSKMPDQYVSLKNIQTSFLNCYFDNSKTQLSFEELTRMKESNFSRYNFFLINHLIHKNKNAEAKRALDKARKLHKTNLLLKQTENFIAKKNYKKIKSFFNCKNPRDVMAEIFYLIANMYAAENDYQLSNFYLKISLFLNNSFLTNKSLLAENLYYEGKYELSKQAYMSLKKIGPVYSWYASLHTAIILLKLDGKEISTSSLQNDFDLLINPNHENYFDLANFYKDSEYYKMSIKYYTLALKNIDQNNFLVPKILYRRGTSYERAGDWENSEKDLLESLEILPDEPNVLNYLAYGWVEKNENIDEALKMLKKATKIKENDGYIIDSLGWAYYMNKNYYEAELYLQRAVELLPLDPVVNDHYADALWMLNKDIQARYFWNHVLNLDKSEKDLKKKVSQKIILGIKNTF